MIALMSPLLLIPDFKKLSAYSGMFISCCVVSIFSILAYEIYIMYERSLGEQVAMTYSDENGKVQ